MESEPNPHDHGSTITFACCSRCGMITLFVIIVVVWTLIRIVQFVSRLWRGADAAGSARIGVVEAA